MAPSRRDFLQKSLLGLGLGSRVDEFWTKKSAVSPPPSSMNAETIYLWPEGSAQDQVTAMGRPRIDVYVPEGTASASRAGILVLPGGAYERQASHEGKAVAEFLAQRGLVAAVLTYRVAERARWPNPFADATRAMRLLRQQATRWQLDPKRLGILGFSAGGHLASTVATQPDWYACPDDPLVGQQSARPDVLALAYPVISMQEYSHERSKERLIGHQPDLAAALSNHRNVNALTPPTFLFHTAEDAGVPVENSLLFAQACAKHKVPLDMHIYAQGRHGVGLAQDIPHLAGWPSRLMEWLQVRGFTS